MILMGTSSSGFPLEERAGCFADTTDSQTTPNGPDVLVDLRAHGPVVWPSGNLAVLGFPSSDTPRRSPISGRNLLDGSRVLLASLPWSRYTVACQKSTYNVHASIGGRESHRSPLCHVISASFPGSICL